MANKPLSIRGNDLTLHAAIHRPQFEAPSVLCSDPWDYVSLWLNRRGSDEASFYWEQARQFYRASEVLPHTASPLTSYYCFLNATKALLVVRKRAWSDKHGVTGHTGTGHCVLQNEIVEFKGSGVLAEFYRLLDTQFSGTGTHDLKSLLWIIPFVHRAYQLTFPSEQELFVPVARHGFSQLEGSKKAWFWGELAGKYAKNIRVDSLPRIFERDAGYEGRWIFRAKKRFVWDRSSETRWVNLRKHNRKMRRNVAVIYSTTNRWYLRKPLQDAASLPLITMPAIYACMHRLSELSRYTPQRLAKHLESKHNWLLVEFLESAPAQFIYGIASEMTGDRFLLPDSFRMLRTKL